MRNTSLNCVYQLAKSDSRVVFIGSDLGPGVLDGMKKEMPERFFMEGVSEQHIIGMSAGLAMEGYIPYINTIAPFITRRCFEQVVLDLCLHNLPVRLIGSGGGVVYAPLGPTHLAADDIGILRTIPNMTIVAPCDAEEMKRLMPLTTGWPHPLYIRLAKGGDQVVSKEANGFQIGKGILMEKPRDLLIISTGITTQIALDSLKIFSNHGISAGVLHMHTVKPLDGKLLEEWFPKVRAVITIEEHSKIGGLGSAVLEYCSDHLPEQTGKIYRIGIPDEFSKNYGSQSALLKHWGITPEKLAEAGMKKLQGIV